MVQPGEQQSTERALEAALAQQVADARLRGQVYAVVVGARAVMRDLRRLDETLYERLSAGQSGVLESADPRAELDRLRRQTLGTLRELLSALHAEGLLNAALSQTTLPDELDFDTVDSTPPDPAADAVDLGEDDILGALEGLAPRRQASASVTEQELRMLVASVGLALWTEVRAFEGRFARELEGGHFQAAMEDLDDTRNSANEAMFALVSGVFHHLLPDADAGALVPGYLSTLERALVVRRTVADFTRLVDAQNAVLQDRATDAQTAEYALGRLRQGITDFIKADAFTALRPADRWEFMKFQRALSHGGAASLRQASEGLAKYLESLSSVSQRDALKRHDAEVLRDLADALEAAQQLHGISASGVVAQLKQAMELAGRLYGRSRDLDVLLTRWRFDPPDLSRPLDAVDVQGQLTTIARALGA